jgi:DNA-binding PadR family transcriptional regulator
MISDIEAVILCLIEMGSSYGYAIEKSIEISNMREWTEVAFSSIYTILRRLKKNNLITSARETVNGRSRNIYLLTETGKMELQQKLLANLSEKQKIISSFDVPIAYLNMLNKEEILASLEEYETSINERIERYYVRQDQIQSRIVDKRPEMFFLTALSERHITMLEAEKEWLHRYIDEIKEKW